MKKRSKMRRALIAATAVAVVAAVTGALRPKAAEVETAVVRRAPMRVTVDADGRTRVRDRYVLAAPVAGRLARLPFAEGAVVRAGDVVARLAPVPLDEPSARQARSRLDAARAAASEAAAQVTLAEASLEQAQRDEERTRRLVAAGALAPRAAEESALATVTRAVALASARGRATSARADVAQAQAALLYAGEGAAVVLVRAPAAGRVLRLPERSERVVAPGTVIAEIGDTRGLEVVVDVLSSDAARVRPGMPVVVERWGADRAASRDTGRVRLVEPAASTKISALGVEEQRVNVIVDVPNATVPLGDGFRVDVRIVVWSASDALTAPAGALVRAGRAWAVYAVRGGRVRVQHVELGELGDGAAQILGGLRESDTVVVFPSDKLRPGARVTTR
ncbi:efflux transporter, RND family, MFP subunit (plasmid) [Gemmatirosa kalamazoonensis]|uniref:Efflux transporter, RND family, MFP subunit n=1 Tax=Gemmatirosa kalamazoonensis TaxID=861299 RepID=W0RQ40_9BACT|nr:efflux RND transporter periplasmic adaptor subunit [Gemmatirosa kalamazoonensis]AHG92597.1 efflux transporter, RND family, MFP subunit [Gemmatirosa kalamazoonensis]